ncbi:2'-5' RNA ligase [Hahella sp. CCB-MM4]|uniref:RNA 2',3'-cyclic phosphodiesterase n=1 Tax=Hahella sp. (strain CCB-MM4) TaxID=1926491 RepID=UPI000B9A6102|nr:RNA 2',3'-cyclic phosphodiesterase [Hahella sp. CCB-MM4]OZG72494.1 2'-5' RNA ligase [Hahella sp. CCB-MM4]
MRCFFGITPNPESINDICQHIGRLQEIAGIPPHVLRWQSAMQLHITLLFMGNITAEDIAAMDPLVEGICKNSQQMMLTTGSTILFPTTRKPRCLVLEILESEELSKLHQEIKTVARETGIQVESRHYHPHLTLARIHKGSRIDFAERQELNIQFNIDKVTLFSSQATEQGSRYDMVREYPLSIE